MDDLRGTGCPIVQDDGLEPDKVCPFHIALGLGKYRAIPSRRASSVQGGHSKPPKQDTTAQYVVSVKWMYPSQRKHSLEASRTEEGAVMKVSRYD